MPAWLLHGLDYAFIALHCLVIGFNLFGWCWRGTRRANLVLLVLTGLSWFGLGIFYGWGYCPLTDWHYDVLQALGETGLPYSYVNYMLGRCCGITADAFWVDVCVVVSYFTSLAISLTLNIRDWRRFA